ncbi:fam-a protein [Plasmodium chabaudi chabaudi]|uniref:Fam-a protein n=1 Tax=Plasmodium chabaudi chabaudi TaxID=31271 RepID=A0A077TM01_PLACU|nr:fam-a protein [Plasmodium chabaudi chabaudi]SCL97974.1 fam-a protein [Plasmodium chabaudi chabaudi]VTZ67143.1 fam-a protein [Plasmodium chabaudi chabaudi]|eukprot:XP_016653252.1 fam-a protein [Plasmodium chabaudi chabaudi]
MGKGYIKIIFPLLVSFLYMSNNALANEANSGIEALRRFARPPPRPAVTNEQRSEETSVQPSSDFYVYTDQTKAAEELMEEAEDILFNNAINTSHYRLYNKFSDDSIEYYKIYGKTKIYKFIHKVPYPNMYYYIVDKLWNPRYRKFGDHIFEEKNARQYTRDLVMIQHRYTNNDIMFSGYYYALGKKYKISDNATLITYTTPSIYDYNRFDKWRFKNTIVESANAFNQKVCSERDILNGELTKMFVHLSGYLIRKNRDNVSITFIHSIDVNEPAAIKDEIIEIVHSAQVQNLIKLTSEVFEE